MIFEDHYDHPISGVSYINQSIAGPGFSSAGYSARFFRYCPCMGHCLVRCDCNPNLNYIDGVLTADKLEGAVGVNECNNFCSCGELCANRVVQKGPNMHLVVKPAGLKGLGLFCTKPLQAGTFISEFAGEMISKDLAEVRFHTERNKYILTLKEKCDGKLQVFYYDATTSGNIGRYINHSCSPNSVVVPVRTGYVVPKPAIFASRFIAENEEITYSYFQGGAIYSNSKCYCCSEKCKGLLPTTISIA